MSELKLRPPKSRSLGCARDDNFVGIAVSEGGCCIDRKAKKPVKLGAGTAVPCPYDSNSGTEGNIPDKRQQEVRGVEVDAETRCVHWRSTVDIVAIKMACCGVYWACKDCHEALAGHAIAVWRRAEWDARAVLCGACGLEMTIWEYVGCEARCPGCGAEFNPGCKKHWRFYFEAEERRKEGF